jgi:hypothetical protein
VPYLTVTGERGYTPSPAVSYATKTPHHCVEVLARHGAAFLCDTVPVSLVRAGCSAHSLLSMGSGIRVRMSGAQ